MSPRFFLQTVLLLCFATALPACDSDTESGTGSSEITCSATTGTPSAEACAAAAAFDATLSESQQATVRASFTEDAADNWSNLPVGGMATRNGLRFDALSDAQKTAALALARTALSDAGYGTFDAIRAADEYLSQNGGGNQYGEDLYYVAFLGTPSATSAWMLQLGGHHYAVNVTYQGSTVSPTPNFVGTEPLTFTLDGQSYAPMAERAATTTALLASLTLTQLTSARLSSSFGDVLLGPGSDGEFPTPSGLQVSALNASQRALVTAAIRAWVIDADETTSASLLAAYTSDEALDQTYVGYSGGTALATQGSYIRIDGPRVWIEIVAQNGVVFSGIHYHSIWRDQSLDYGGLLF